MFKREQTEEKLQRQYILGFFIDNVYFKLNSNFIPNLDSEMKQFAKLMEGNKIENLKKAVHQKSVVRNFGDIPQIRISPFFY